MKALHLISSVSVRSGGTTTAFLGLLDALAQDGRVEPEAMAAHSANHDDDIKSSPRAGVPISLASSINRKFPSEMARMAGDRMEQGGVDVLHLHGLWCMDLVAAAKKARGLGITTIWQPHGMLVQSALKISRWKKALMFAAGLRRELRHAGALVYCSHSEQRLSKDVAQRKTIEPVIPLPVEEPPSPEELAKLRDRGFERFDIIKGTPHAVFVGRLHPVKRPDLTIRALAACPNQQVRLLFLGDGEPSYVDPLHSLVSQLGLDDRVSFAGWVSGDDRFAAIAASDLLVLNSMFENFGLVVPEALRLGVPAVVTKELAFADYVSEHDLGSVASADPDEIGRAIASTLDRPDRAQLADRAQRFIHDQLAFASVGSALAGLYERVVGSPISETQDAQ